jgi:hypothetical protein
MNISSFKTSIFFKQLSNSLIYAQDMAIGSGCHVKINITSSSLTLKSRDNCKSGDFNRDIQDPFYKKNNYIQNAPNNTNLSTNNFPIYFDHNGQARLISTNNITNANLTITGNNLQETIYIYGENGSIE